ncbi:MAG: hypothetical protein HY647_12195 [Acidobacteria bacterium]|nr:hypothetical protein [Acidobacteriota bacterium]
MYNPGVGVLRKTLPCLLVIAFSLVFLLNLCDLLFRCGCLSWWQGADRYCNIHQAGVSHCPWCSYGWWGFIVPFGLIAMAQAGVLYAIPRLSWRARLVLSLLCFPVVGAFVGLVFALIADYPSFLFLRLF